MTINKLSEYSTRTPLIGHFELTHNCSFKCEFCYNHIKEKPELCTEDVLKIIDQVAELGCLYINFSGGEPLLRKDFNDIYLYTKKRYSHFF
jgi:pyrroloquinoline quinone biosynthesis protein E